MGKFEVLGLIASVMDISRDVELRITLKILLSFKEKKKLKSTRKSWNCRCPRKEI
jgi:hypothetical protein